MKFLITFLVSVGICLGQQDTLGMSAASPQSVIPTVTYNGLSGGQEYCYWVTATYPRGKSPGQSPKCVFVTTLSAGNSVTVTWNPVGATNYDVLRTTTENLPTSCTNCLLASATNILTVTDTGAGLGGYTLSNIASPVQGAIVLDNRNFLTPEYVFQTWPVNVPSIVFPDGTLQSTAFSTSYISSIQTQINNLSNVGTFISQLPKAQLLWTAGSVNDGACVVNQMPLMGATLDNVTLALQWPSTLQNGLIGSARVSQTNIIEFRLCNLSGGTLVVTTGTYGATLIN